MHAISGIGTRDPSNEATATGVGKEVQFVKKGKVHPCTGTEALYRSYGP